MSRYHEMSRKDRIKNSDEVAIRQLEKELRKKIKKTMEKIVEKHKIDPEIITESFNRQFSKYLENTWKDILKKWKQKRR